jgi:hypothetical protein
MKRRENSIILVGNVDAVQGLVGKVELGKGGHV